MVPHFHVRQYTWVLPLLSALIKVSPASIASELRPGSWTWFIKGT